jgi:hypothetical protein
MRSTEIGATSGSGVCRTSGANMPTDVARSLPAMGPGARIGEIANRQTHFVQTLRTVAQVVADAAQHQLVRRAFAVPDGDQIALSAARKLLQQCCLFA